MFKKLISSLVFTLLLSTASILLPAITSAKVYVHQQNDFVITCSDNFRSHFTQKNPNHTFATIHSSIATGSKPVGVDVWKERTTPQVSQAMYFEQIKKQITADRRVQLRSEMRRDRGQSLHLLYDLTTRPDHVFTFVERIYSIGANQYIRVKFSHNRDHYAHVMEIIDNFHVRPR